MYQLQVFISFAIIVIINAIRNLLVNSSIAIVIEAISRLCTSSLTLNEKDQAVDV